MSDLDGGSQQRVVPRATLADAVDYVTQVKTHFADQPEKFARFISLFDDYRKNKIDFFEATHDIIELFGPARHLVRNLAHFLPNGYRLDLNDTFCPRPLEARAASIGVGFVQQGALELVQKFRTRFESQPEIIDEVVQMLVSCQVPKLGDTLESYARKVLDIVGPQNMDLVTEFDHFLSQHTQIAAPVKRKDQPDDQNPSKFNWKRLKTMPASSRPGFFVLNEIKRVLTDADISSTANMAVYREFLRALSCYSRGLLRRDELIVLVGDSFLAGERELLRLFVSLFEPAEITHEELDAIMNRCRRTTEINEYGPITKRSGMSYRLLPDSFPRSTCSGRTQLCKEVLNDDWVNSPHWSDQEPVFRRKSNFEEMLIKCDDEQFEMDMSLHLLSITIAGVENFVATSAMMSETELRNREVDDSLGGSSSVLYLKCFKTVFAERAREVMDALQMNPAENSGVILDTLRARYADMLKEKEDMSKVWSDSRAKNTLRSLDVQGAQFKYTDRRALNAKMLISEIECSTRRAARPRYRRLLAETFDVRVVIAAEREDEKDIEKKTEDATQSLHNNPSNILSQRLMRRMPHPYQMRVELDSPEILRDICRLLGSYINGSGLVANAEKDRVFSFFATFLSEWFGRTEIVAGLKAGWAAHAPRTRGSPRFSAAASAAIAMASASASATASFTSTALATATSSPTLATSFAESAIISGADSTDTTDAIASIENSSIPEADDAAIGTEKKGADASDLAATMELDSNIGENSLPVAVVKSDSAGQSIQDSVAHSTPTSHDNWNNEDRNIMATPLSLSRPLPALSLEGDQTAQQPLKQEHHASDISDRAHSHALPIPITKPRRGRPKSVASSASLSTSYSSSMSPTRSPGWPLSANNPRNHGQDSDWKRNPTTLSPLLLSSDSKPESFEGIVSNQVNGNNALAGQSPKKLPISLTLEGGKLLPDEVDASILKKPVILCLDCHYLFFRIFQLLYSRLHSFKARIHMEGGLENLQQQSASELYEAAIDLACKMVSGNTDQNSYEDQLRTWFGKNGYLLNTLDKYIVGMVKQIQVIVNDKKAKEILSLYYAHRTSEIPADDSTPSAYRNLCESLVLPDERLYRLEFNQETQVMCISLLDRMAYRVETERLRLNDWVQYSDRYVDPDATSLSEPLKKLPFLRRSIVAYRRVFAADNLGLGHIAPGTFKLWFDRNTEFVLLVDRTSRIKFSPINKKTKSTSQRKMTFRSWLAESIARKESASNTVIPSSQALSTVAHISSSAVSASVSASASASASATATEPESESEAQFIPLNDNDKETGFESYSHQPTDEDN